MNPSNEKTALGGAASQNNLHANNISYFNKIKAAFVRVAAWLSIVGGAI
ncbi:hypothetical protein [Candidatus Methylospira mobilis]|nr:hypothetical protein [Candidatus Methylospira mobilis]